MQTKQKDTGIVNIHGKEYLTVAKRVTMLREDHSDWTIDTEIHSVDDETVIMKARILNEAGRLIGVGHAEERRNATQINRTSALENCETSAIGRALSACGYAGTEYASANEVEQAIAEQTRGALAQKIKKETAQQYQTDIAACLRADEPDDLGVRELWDEMGRDYQEWIWGNFSSKQQTAIRQALKNTQA